MPDNPAMSPLRPPTLPFASPPSSPLSSRRSSTTPADTYQQQQPPLPIPRSDSVSLSTHYLPAKYTALHEPGNYPHRRNSGFSRDSIGDGAEAHQGRGESPVAGRTTRRSRFLPSSLALAHKAVPRGGGQGAFASDASRIGGEAEEGDEVVGADGMRQRRGFGNKEGEREDQRLRFDEGEERGQKNGKKHGRLVWNRFKWCIFCANLVVRPSAMTPNRALISFCLFSIARPTASRTVTPPQLLIYAIAILIVALLVWFDVFYRSDVIRVGNRTELISA